MEVVFLLTMVLLIPTHSQTTQFQDNPVNDPSRRTSSRGRLSRPLIGRDGKVYACSDKDLLAFESNGSIAWTMHLNYTCKSDMAPVHGGRGKVRAFLENVCSGICRKQLLEYDVWSVVQVLKALFEKSCLFVKLLRQIYLVAGNKVIKINLLNNGTSEPSAQVLLSTEPTKDEQGGVVGIAVSTLSSSIFVTVQNRGLFAYMTRGQLVWSAGPVIELFGYRQGCRKNNADCYFNSVPVIDECEASIYISNTEGEIYSLSIRSPHFKWIQDLSSYDKVFTITAGNNGRLYVTVPVKALLLALDVSSGNVLWEGIIGPLSNSDYTPIVDSNGWISIGSLDGFLYSFSPTGILKKFSITTAVDSVIQVSPVLDCTGYAIYISQTKMEGKISHAVGEYTYVSAMKPKSVHITLYVPATGSIYWSDSYPGNFVYVVLLLQILNSKDFICQSFLFLSPSGNGRAILLFLLFESAILVLLAGPVRFCCIFWSKKKLQGEKNLGSFLEKRRSLRLKKKTFDRTITELEQAAVEAVTSAQVLEKLSNLLQKRQFIERKLSTTYSLGRDGGSSSRSKSLLPSYDGKKTRSVVHTLSDASSSSRESSSSGGGGESEWSCYESKGKAAAVEEVSSSSDGLGFLAKRSASKAAASSSRESEPNIMIGSSGSLSLKRRRALSSTY
nr:protein GAMETE EXPRESSED 3 [Malus domestica]